MSEGVEWALHSILNLAWAGPERAVSAARLAAYYDLPPAYLNKQLQALARAGLVTSSPGPRGGFRLARKLEDITLMDVVTAIEGPEEAFRCTQIRLRAPRGRSHEDDPAHELAGTCQISQAMREAELVWRRELAGRTIADIKERVERVSPGVPVRARRWFAAARTS
ncbi:MAG TPA: Rrf2 family transcriptional regulator [Streptomyces sp.]|uniref:RrF2 family transcriptional regulator n=1 Tax=Streptomyces sp. TaxID=1931 RepID=UPI002D5068EF|nr:Rrf2 family transcriptional regulator [Streptomyces sp.]HZG03035.1 Rrf2 family transcriptional regulator [Streptomyces sp.]